MYLSALISKHAVGMHHCTVIESPSFLLPKLSIQKSCVFEVSENRLPKIPPTTFRVQKIGDPKSFKVSIRTISKVYDKFYLEGRMAHLFT